MIAFICRRASQGQLKVSTDRYQRMAYSQHFLTKCFTFTYRTEHNKKCTYTKWFVFCWLISPDTYNERQNDSRLLAVAIIVIYWRQIMINVATKNAIFMSKFLRQRGYQRKEDISIRHTHALDALSTFIMQNISLKNDILVQRLKPHFRPFKQR